MECEFLEACPFFNDQLEKMPSTAGALKRRFCCGEPNTCARYIVRMALGKASVPAQLFPNDRHWADRLVYR